MESLEVEKAGGIATVTFHRPPVNALTRRVMHDLTTIFDGFADDREVIVAVFRVVPDRAFVAGVDLNDVSGPDEESTPAAMTDRGKVAREMFRSIHECAVPVIAAVDKAAIGGGFALASCCDMIIATERATFGMTEINMGLLGASSHLVRMLGPYRARDMFFTGRMATAAELAAAGVIVRVVADPADLDAVADEYARALAGKSPLALRLAKESMNRTEDLPFQEGYRVEQDYTARMVTFEDSAEARQAFFDKRDPVWKWR
ncbi:enoyl-CoA hydratase-related protein [Nocardia sp. NPDC005366]|uniref:enoyl-CoA hydratase-related protein n=1 Tax=Nocardia sp. NPDC005366 TaxID=3156878 RepID=UPI0033A21399